MRIQGLEDYTYNEILSLIDGYVKNIIDEHDLNIVFINSMLYGSRLRNMANPSSDLDYVFEYSGNIKEDAVFNIMHDEPYYVEGIEIDINPIRKEESGDLNSYKVKSNSYDKEVAKKLHESTQYNPLNESKNLSIALDLLSDDLIEEFKEQIISNHMKENLQLEYILSMMDNNQLSKYLQLSKSDEEHIKMAEIDSEKELEIARYNELSKSLIVLDLIMWMENTEHLYNLGESIVKMLLKKEHRGEQLSLEKLESSSVIDNLVRQTIRDYEKNIERVNMYPILRKVLKREFAKNILIWVDDWR